MDNRSGQSRCIIASRELFYALPLALMFLLALTPGISFTEDLGRHILLGKIIVSTGQVPDINLLTYTYPDFPFINHHWLSEVVFYLIHRAVGLNGLILLKALLMCATLALAMRSLQLRIASPLIVFAATLSAIALGYRAHIRPELFTYLGVALYGWMIARSECSSDKKFSGFRWFLLIAYGWFWANAHIYFIFGIGMIGAYWLACWRRNWPDSADPVTPKQERYAETLRHAWPRAETVGLLALIGVSLLNPNGWRGLLYPLGIFNNYGVAITENASPLDYWKTVFNPMLIALPFLSLFALWVFGRTLIGWLGRPARLCPSAGQGDNSCRPWRPCPACLTAGQLAGVLILLVALIASWRMARSAPLLALTLLPLLGFCVGTGRSELIHKKRLERFFNITRPYPHFIKCGYGFRAGWLKWSGIIFVVALNLWLIFAVLEGSYCRIFPSPIGPTPFGFDDESRYLALRHLSADGLPMPVFSDYNSGSLVEYNIYPERGYVDNRPEAFPEIFWKQEYEPALALGKVWEDIIARRNIQTVAVSIAGVKERFIRTLLADPRWQLVHLDFFCTVFTRNTPANQAVLRRHAFGHKQIVQFADQTSQRIRALSSESIWRRQVLADQIVYEIYGLICLDANDLAWPLVWEMHLRYPDYQLIHELMRVSAPPYAAPAVMDTLARRARWPLAVKQVLDWGVVLEAQGRLDEACAVYRRGKIFFPFSKNLPTPVSGTTQERIAASARSLAEH